MNKNIPMFFAVIFVVAAGAWIITANKGVPTLDLLGSSAVTVTPSAFEDILSENLWSEHDVIYTDTGYVPESITVYIGDTVYFKNQSSVEMWTASNPHPAHTILSEFDSKQGMKPGEEYSFTFMKAGMWVYHNHLNPGHTGTIIVEEIVPE